MENTEELDLIYQDELYCDKNIDRSKFLKFDENIFLISAAYQLDKETNTKSGGFYASRILYNQDNSIYGLDQTKNFTPLEYGILEFKFLLEKNKIYTANSDTSFSIFNMAMHENGLSSLEFNLYKNYNFVEDENKSDNCCNFIELSKYREETVLLAMNDGSFSLFDQTSEKIFFSKKGHEYGLWSTLFLNENVFLTGSEDSMLKMWDIRQKSLVETNKSHQASINCIIKDDKNFFSGKTNGNDLNIITGSYDETIYFFDIRNFKEEIYKKKLNCSIWDIKQIDLKSKEADKNKRLFLLSCIYEGLRIYDLDINGEINSKKFDLNLVCNIDKAKEKSHKSIVYGIDYYYPDFELSSASSKDKADLLIVSSSFYDNKIMLWKI